jgi:peroxiredoxin
MGGTVLAISVDPPERSRRLVKAYDLPYPILCDTKREVIKKYGLVHPGAGRGASDIAIPANILIDQSGKIVWQRVAKLIQDRPDPQEVLAAVRNMTGEPPDQR